MDYQHESHPKEELEDLKERLLKVEEKLFHDLNRKAQERTNSTMNTANPSDLLNKFNELK